VKSKLFSLFWAAGLALGFLTLAPARAQAQEGEMQVVDEVIAQINDNIITLSLLKREIKERIEALKQGGMTEQQATDEVTKNKPQLIFTLINEQLLLQKGKELELTDKVEAEVNKRMLDVATEQGIKSIEELYKAMRENKVDPEETRQMLRKEIMKQGVIQEEVDSKVFLGFTMDELHKYFDAHKDKFHKPEGVTLSEIYLSFVGKNEPAVKARVDQLVAQLRGGAAFGPICVANSEREERGVRMAESTQCKVGTFEVPNLREDLVAALKSVKVGGVSDPLRSNDGYQILRVDERTPASDASVFNENQVREAMTIERSPKARDEYLQGLRNEAYIKIAESYKASLLPLLNLKPEVIVETTGDASASPADHKKPKGKFLKIFPKP
jgi:parvulin-like peptidyl-prolyl isomerase